MTGVISFEVIPAWLVRCMRVIKASRRPARTSRAVYGLRVGDRLRGRRLGGYCTVIGFRYCRDYGWEAQLQEDGVRFTCGMQARQWSHLYERVGRAGKGVVVPRAFFRPAEDA